MKNKSFAVIYVMESESTWRNFAMNTLCTVGYPAKLISDPHELLTYPQTGRPSMIILGFSMIGLQELGIIRDLACARAERLVILASSLSSQTIRQAFLNGASDVAVKSFSGHALIQIVEEQQRDLEMQSNYVLLRKRSHCYE